VRELDHAIERGVLLAQGNQVKASDLGLRAAGQSGSARLEEMSLEEVGRFLVQKTLARFDSNVSQAAKALGLSRSGLYRRMQKYGLCRKFPMSAVCCCWRWWRACRARSSR